MKYLFLFAHPDDETIASAGTIKQLSDTGNEVMLVSATDGAAGEVIPEAQQKLSEFTSVGQMRRNELQQVANLLGITHLRVLDFVDGELNNKQVWGALTAAFVSIIDEFKPDVLVTFDHSGWYYHLDHVGVSIAATTAFHQASHVPDCFFLNYLRVKGSKWKYFYPEIVPITHYVDVTMQRDLKLQALNLHLSQDTKTVEKKIADEQTHYELYQLVTATSKGEELFAKHSIFHKITPDINIDQITALS